MKFCGSNQASLTGQSTMDNGQKKDMRQRTRNWTFLQQRKKLFKWNVALKTTADWSFGSSLEDFPGIYTAKKKIDYVSHKKCCCWRRVTFSVFLRRGGCSISTGLRSPQSGPWSSSWFLAYFFFFNMALKSMPLASKMGIDVEAIGQGHGAIWKHRGSASRETYSFEGL